MANNETKTLGDFIRTARVGKGISLRELARRLEITPSYQSDIENDRRIPADEILRASAKELSIDFEHLMALAVRFTDEAERYIRRHPTAGTLFRKITERDLSEEDLKKLLRAVEKVNRPDTEGK